MAIVAEYLEQIHNSIKDLDFLMPPNSKLLVEQLLFTKGENTDLPEEIYEAIPGEVIPDNIYYYECYMLVQNAEDDPEKVYLLKEGLLESPELDDISPRQRAEFLEKWLMKAETNPDARTCDFLIAEEYEGDTVFVPNRFPIEFCHDDEAVTLEIEDALFAIPKAKDISFMVVLEKTA